MGAKYAITTEGSRTLTAAATKTILELIGDADVLAVLVEMGLSFAGAVSTDVPILLELYQITATGTGTALTEVKWGRGAGTAQVTGKVLHTVEPTKVDRLASWYVHPQGGNLLVQWPLGREPVICDGSAAQGLALVYTTAAGVSPACTGYMVVEE